MSIYGTVFNDGVKYLKINKFDTDGVDKSDYLTQMISIRINHEDVGVKQYNIATTQVQNNYFIFGLANPQAITSSVGDINDYSFLATSASSFTYNFVPFGTTNEYYNNRVSSYGSISGNTLGFMTASSGIYTSGQTPNKSIQIRISGSGTLSSGTTSLYAYITKPNGSVLNGTLQTILINSSYSGGNFDVTLYLTSSFSIVENNLIGFGLYKGIEPISFTCTSFNVSMSLYDATPFNGSSSLIDFDPDALNFDYNDYNPLLDNAEIPQYSTAWMDIDYSQNPLVPINFGLIISGTADRAFVQDSNYSSKAWSNIRYNGSRTTSYRINQ
jgi:hypothetical protein